MAQLQCAAVSVRGLGALLACLGAAAAAAASAGAVITPQRGIAGVQLGMSKTQVRKVLGKPGFIKRGRTAAVHIRTRSGRFALGYYTEYRWAGLRVVFTGDRNVTSISTSRRTERTSSGVGVGTSKDELKAKVSGLHCRAGLGTSYCYSGSLKRGSRLTLFYLAAGHVARVEVGISFARV